MAEPNRTPNGPAETPQPAGTDPDRDLPAHAANEVREPADREPAAAHPAHAAEPATPTTGEAAAAPTAPVETARVEAPAAGEPAEPARRVEPAFSNARADRSHAVRDDATGEVPTRQGADDSVPAIPPAPGTQTVLAPAEEPAAAPKRGGNRLAGTAWVLLAAGLFEVLYLAAIALVVLLLGGAQAVVPQLVPFASSPFAWLPVLLFFLLFELTVLLINRAGRFAYVIASLIVGLLVYVLSVFLISILLGGGIGDRLTLARAFESPEFILAGLIAREVMLWTGFAIGARGTRVRKRNRAAKDAYRQRRTERSDAAR